MSNGLYRFIQIFHSLLEWLEHHTSCTRNVRNAYTYLVLFLRAIVHILYSLRRAIIRIIRSSSFHFSAAVLLRMMSHFLTEDVLRNGLIKYLRAQLVSRPLGIPITPEQIRDRYRFALFYSFLAHTAMPRRTICGKRCKMLSTSRTCRMTILTWRKWWTLGSNRRSIPL